MGKRGPAKVPTAVKRARAKPTGRRLPTSEPKPPQEMHLTPPDGLHPHARAEWVRLANELAGQNLLTSWDVQTFRCYCDAYAHYRVAEDALRASGAVIAAGDKGYSQVTPFWTVRNKALEQMHRLGACLGLNPSARAGLDVSKAGNTDKRSEWEKDLGRRTGT